MRQKILGIGLSRTGTKSLAFALRSLGYVTAHFAEHIAVHRGRDTWFRGSFVADELAEFDAAIDLPIATFFAELDQRYPRSKFILTMRDAADWLASMRGHFARRPLGEGSDSEYRCLVRQSTYGVTDYHPEALLAARARHESAVRAHFAHRPDDLLIMNIRAGDGWEPLCSFLGVPVPAEPFPWVNRGEDRAA